MKAGLICDRTYDRIALFDSFRYAITALYPDIIDVTSVKDLKGLNVVFISHPNHGPNLQVCASTGFIETCNELGIIVVVFFSEKIRRDENKTEVLYTQNFLDYFNEINPVLFRNLTSDEDYKFRLFNYLKGAEKGIIYAYDVADCQTYNLKLFRVAMSNKYKHLGELIPFSLRKKEIVFRGNHYKTRRYDLDLLRTRVSLPCYFEKNPFNSWYAYMLFLSKYQFIISPFGNANAFVSRFYEALTLKSIVIQQVAPNTLQYYDKEARFKNCIFFTKMKHVPELLNNYIVPEERAEIWLEDVLKELLEGDGLL